MRKWPANGYTQLRPNFLADFVHFISGGVPKKTGGLSDTFYFSPISKTLKISCFLDLKGGLYIRPIYLFIFILSLPLSCLIFSFCLSISYLTSSAYYLAFSASASAFISGYLPDTFLKMCTKRQFPSSECKRQSRKLPIAEKSGNR